MRGLNTRRTGTLKRFSIPCAHSQTTSTTGGGTSSEADIADSTEKTVVKTVVKTTVKTTVKTVVKTGMKTGMKIGMKTTEKSVEKTTEKSVEKSVEKTTEKNVKKTTEKSAVETNMPLASTESLPENLPENLAETAKKIYFLLSENGKYTYDRLASVIGMTRETIRVSIRSLVDAGLIRRVGPDKGGHWEVIVEKLLAHDHCSDIFQLPTGKWKGHVADENIFQTAFGKCGSGFCNRW